jgi:hypothetical protein
MYIEKNAIHRFTLLLLLQKISMVVGNEEKKI